MRNRKKRNREAFYKIFFLLSAVVSAVGLQLFLPHETPLPFQQKDEPVFSFILNDRGTFRDDHSFKKNLRFNGEKRKINLNRATIEELLELPGIGEKSALKILEYKKINGPYRSIEEIMQVNGVGPKKFEMIKSFISTD